MALRSGGRKLSFEILSASNSIEDEETLFYRSNSDPIHEGTGVSQSESRTNRRKRKHRGSRKKKMITTPIDEDPITDKVIDSVFDDPACVMFGNGSCPNRFDVNYQNCSMQSVVTVLEESVRTVCLPESEFQNLRGDGHLVGELRQRTVNGSGGSDDDMAGLQVDVNVAEESVTEVSSSGKQRSEQNGGIVKILDSAESLDWKRLMAEDPICEYIMYLDFDTLLHWFW